MNPVEIEEAVSDLALEPFDQAEFPFQFLRAGSVRAKWLTERDSANLPG